jgi:hypothetical protein
VIVFKSSAEAACAKQAATQLTSKNVRVFLTSTSIYPVRGSPALATYTDLHSLQTRTYKHRLANNPQKPQARRRALSESTISARFDHILRDIPRSIPPPNKGKAGSRYFCWAFPVRRHFQRECCKYSSGNEDPEHTEKPLNWNAHRWLQTPPSGADRTRDNATGLALRRHIRGYAVTTFLRCGPNFFRLRDFHGLSRSN